MSKLDILTFPDPRLRNHAKPVAQVDDAIRRIVDDMFETMYAAPGIGLAATQVNIPKRIIVIDVSEEHEAVLGRMIRVAAEVARKEGIAGDGYRLIVNCRDFGGQEVYHVHLHLLGGRPLGPMLAR